MKKKKLFFFFMVFLICSSISFLFFQSFNHHVLSDEEKKVHQTFLHEKMQLLDRYVDDDAPYPDFYSVKTKNSLDDLVLISYSEHNCPLYEIKEVQYGIKEISVLLRGKENLKECSQEEQMDFAALHVTNPFRIPYVVVIEKNDTKTTIHSFNEVYLQNINAYVNNEKK